MKDEFFDTESNQFLLGYLSGPHTDSSEYVHKLLSSHIATLESNNAKLKELTTNLTEALYPCLNRKETDMNPVQLTETWAQAAEAKITKLQAQNAELLEALQYTLNWARGFRSTAYPPQSPWVWEAEARAIIERMKP